MIERAEEEMNVDAIAHVETFQDTGASTTLLSTREWRRILEMPLLQPTWIYMTCVDEWLIEVDWAA